MLKNIPQENISERRLLSWGVSQIITPIKELANVVSKLKTNVFSVQIENPDTDVLLEVAKNTRGLKEPLKKMAEARLSTDKLEARLSELSTVLTKMPQQKEVSITNFKDFIIPQQKSEIKVTNLSEIKFPTPKTEVNVDILPLEKAIKDVKKALFSIYDYLPSLKQADIKIPKFPDIKIPDKVSMKEAGELIKAFTDGLQGVRDDLAKVYEVIDEKEFGGGASQPTMIGSATVTSVSINSLRGDLKTTAVTIGVSATAIPPTSMQYRKSVSLYNNSASTMYIGGSDVTVDNGFPVPAYSYSPPIDAASTMKMCAIAESNNLNARVLEASSEREGG